MAFVISRRVLNCCTKSNFTYGTLLSFRSNYLYNRPQKVLKSYVQTDRQQKFQIIYNENRLTWSKNLRHFSSNCNDKSGETTVAGKEKKLSLFQRFKQMYRDYWYVLVPVHLVTSAAWFGGFYYMASSGVDIPVILESLNFSEKIINSMRNSSMGYIAITYGLYKIATPARYAVTLGGTTLSINYLTKWGYIKPMPSKERLKEIYAETKEGMKEKKDNLMESVHTLQQTVEETKKGIKGTKNSIVTSVKESQKSIKNIKEKVIGSTTQKHNGK